MKRKIFLGALLTASAALLSAMFNVESKETPVPAKKPVIRIGATLPLSGENAYIGNSVRNAMEWLSASGKSAVRVMNINWCLTMMRWIPKKSTVIRIGW